MNREAESKRQVTLFYNWPDIQLSAREGSITIPSNHIRQNEGVSNHSELEQGGHHALEPVVVAPHGVLVQHPGEDGQVLGVPSSTYLQGRQKFYF